MAVLGGRTCENPQDFSRGAWGSIPPAFTLQGGRASYHYGAFASTRARASDGESAVPDVVRVHQRWAIASGVTCGTMTPTTHPSLETSCASTWCTVTSGGRSDRGDDRRSGYRRLSELIELDIVQEPDDGLELAFELRAEDLAC
jgi:hypothetical protein